MEPTLFRSRRLIEGLADLAIGFSLAALTSVVFAKIFGTSTPWMTVITGAPTLVIGTLWARLLRSTRLVVGRSVRLGWLLSVPLAATNSAIAAGLMLAAMERGQSRIVNFVTGFVAGATIGAMFWIPALVMTLVLFGVPIAWGQRLARRGISGQERGDAFVGAASAAIALGALLIASLWLPTRKDLWFSVLLGVVAVLAGGASALLALQRDRHRRAFVRRVEAGAEPRFRVDPTPEGKVLLRIVSSGEGYRVADHIEAIAHLDREGDLTRGR